MDLNIKNTMVTFIQNNLHLQLLHTTDSRVHTLRSYHDLGSRRRRAFVYRTQCYRQISSMLSAVALLNNFTLVWLLTEPSLITGCAAQRIMARVRSLVKPDKTSLGNPGSFHADD